MALKPFTVGGEEIHIDINSHNAKNKGRTVAGTKRKVSKKTLDNLKRGRAALAAKRKIRPIEKKRVRLTRLKKSDREQVRKIIKAKSLYGATRKVRRARSLSQEGVIVAKRKRARKSAKRRRVHGVAGFEGRARKRRHRIHGLAGTRRRRRHSGRLMGGLNIGGIKKQVLPIALGIAGAGVAAFALSKLPEKMNPMVKAGIPLGAGILASVMVRNPMIGAAGMGMAIIGGYALARQALPTFVPALSGVEDTVHASMIGMGDIQSLEDMRGDLDGEIRQLGNATDISGDMEGDMEGDDVLGDMEGDMEGEMEGEMEGIDAL
jgi:hypothetical protein